MNTGMHISPEAMHIMKDFPTLGHRTIEEVSDELQQEVNEFCNTAQIKMINRHHPAQTPTERRRGEAVKAGRYTGKKSQVT